MLTSFLACARSNNGHTAIDRHALVTRHNVKLTKVDSLGSLSVGNGEFAFTVDVSGLQTFPESYEDGISLGTQSQWGWHSFAGQTYSIDDVTEWYPTCGDRRVPYAVQHDGGTKKAAADWLRTNPHRLHLGLVGLVLLKEDGTEALIDDLEDVNQELDLWSGKITSAYQVEGIPVRVELFGHQDRDQIAARIESPLIAQRRLKVRFRFPYGNDCHVCPGYDWDQPDKHDTSVLTQTDGNVTWQRRLDATSYYVSARWQGTGTLTSPQAHTFELSPEQHTEQLEISVLFTPAKAQEEPADFDATARNSQQRWKQFWTEGGAFDCSECTDPRAQELERRVVLSQYLTRIQTAGSLPPQETGLTMNSWYGKFHLEMHWWHGVHFALWNRAPLLEKSLGWYSEVAPRARETARWQGYDGIRWQKMTGPDGRKAPSSVGELLVWQQPHMIYFAELLYRLNPSRAVLERYKDLVFETADFMVSYAQLSEDDQRYHLCHPLIPAQEVFPPDETDDPPFELAYWHYGLSVARKWAQRLGVPAPKRWKEVQENLAPLPEADGLYLPSAGALDAYTDDRYRRDHPVVTGAYGMLPLSPMIDTAVMEQTFRNIMKKWNWETTWGWDYPMLAMAAARLGDPESAIDALLMDTQKNTYLVNGHNYQDERLRLYLPGNGGLLTAVAMMAAGWDGAPDGPNPGFPANGKWNVKWDGLQVMP
jgi:hypothetical protein